MIYYWYRKNLGWWKPKRVNNFRYAKDSFSFCLNLLSDHIFLLVSNENKCLLIWRFKVCAIFADSSRLSSATLCCIVWAPVAHAQPRLPHWLAGKWGRLRSALMCEVAVGRKPKKEGEEAEAEAAEKRPLDSHKAPGLSPGSWSKRCTPSALQAVKQQQQRQRQ